MSFIVFTALVLGGCQKKAPAPVANTPIPTALALSQARHHQAVQLTAEVENWITRMSSQQDLAQHEKTASILQDVKFYLDRIRYSLDSARKKPLINLRLEDDMKELEKSYVWALASIPSERKAAEEKLAQSIVDMSHKIIRFRIEASSINVQNNQETVGHIQSLEAQKRALSQTYAQLRKADIPQWGSLYRRGESQLIQFEEQIEQALTRLPLIANTPRPSPFTHRRNLSKNLIGNAAEL